MVSIANAVGSGDLGRELNLPAIQADLDVPYTEYDPSNYHGLYVRLVEDGPLITIYRTGKYIISGCSSFGELFESNDEFLETLGRAGIVSSPGGVNFDVQNVVCTGELDAPVDLNAIAVGLGLESTEYEPEQFPGLIYRPADEAAVTLVFANGKVVITGSPAEEGAEAAFQQLQSRVSEI